jgi:hypothetical protein
VPVTLAASGLSCDSRCASKAKASKAATEKHCLDNNTANGLDACNVREDS